MVGIYFYVLENLNSVDVPKDVKNEYEVTIRTSESRKDLLGWETGYRFIKQMTKCALSKLYRMHAQNM